MRNVSHPRTIGKDVEPISRSPSCTGVDRSKHRRQRRPSPDPWQMYRTRIITDDDGGRGDTGSTSVTCEVKSPSQPIVFRPPPARARHRWQGGGPWRVTGGKRRSSSPSTPCMWVCRRGRGGGEGDDFPAFEECLFSG